MAANSSNLLLISSLFITALIIFSSSSTVSASGGDGSSQFNWVPTMSASTCQGSLAECLTSAEFTMDSEINRRILATTPYIGYGALQRDSVPCSLRGASYYNCQPGAEANPYNRGCSAIARCRSNS